LTRKAKNNNVQLKLWGCQLSEPEFETSPNPQAQMKLTHELYLRAIDNPLRRKILDALKQECVALDVLKKTTGLDEDTLLWHLAVLESGQCIERESKEGELFFKLTKWGQVVDYLR